MNAIRRAVVLFAALLWAMVGSVTAGQAAPYGGWSRTPKVPDCFGVNIHFSQARPGEMRMIAAAGFRWVRTDELDWRTSERIKGRYNFRPYDRLLASLERYHMRAVWILDYGNPLYTRGNPPYPRELTSSRFWQVHGNAPATPASRRAFCRWAAAMVRHFQGHGIVWEMWNEPDPPKPGDTFWLPRSNAVDYAHLAVDVGKTIRHVAPHELYVGPALAWIGLANPAFLQKIFQLGVLKYFDAVTIHPYNYNWSPEAVGKAYDMVRGLIARYAPPGKTIPVIEDEWGQPLAAGKISPARQARLLARAFLVNLSQRVPLSIWYDWRDDGPNPKVAGQTYGLVHFKYHFGRNPVYTPKPAYLAAKTLMTQLSGCLYVKRLKMGNSNVYILLFTGPKGSCIAAWKIGKKTHTVAVPLQPGRYQLTNETGTQTRILTIPADAQELRLTVSHDPEYLRWQK